MGVSMLGLARDFLPARPSTAPGELRYLSASGRSAKWRHLSLRSAWWGVRWT